MKVSRDGDKAPERQCKCCPRPAEGGVGRVAREARRTPELSAEGKQQVEHGVGVGTPRRGRTRGRPRGWVAEARVKWEEADAPG